MLTRFEKARIMGSRALQISMGAPVLIKPPKRAKPVDIAMLEFEKGVLPMAVIRKMPNGSEIILNMKGEEIGEAKK